MGGISGEVTNGGNIENCIAISQAIYGENTMGRIAGRNNGSLASNYAFSEMKVNGNTISGGASDNENGKNVTVGQIYTSAFFTSSDNWENAAWAQDVWVFRDCKLPVLAKLPGQSDDGGLYLNRRDIQYATVTPSSFTYNGSLQLPNIKFDGEILKEGKDYTVRITSTDGGGTSSGIQAGTVEIEITGIGNFTGKKDITYNINPKSLEDGMVTIQEGQFTYTGNEHKPTITVNDGDKTLMAGEDYEATYFDNINVGTATVKIQGNGNYTGEVNKEFTIEKATLPADIHKEIAVMEKYRHEYEVNLTELLPNVSGNFGTIEFTPATTENSEGLLGTLNYTSGDTIILPVNPVAGVNRTAQVTVKVESSNYQDFNIVITLKTTNKQLVNISGITMAGGVFNGEPYAYVGTPVFTLGSEVLNIEYTVQYQSTDGGGYSSEEAPTDAGEYLLTISVLERDDIPYTGSQSYPFTIQRRPVTIIAEDKTMTARGQLPTFTYIVEGQLPGETALIGEPTLTSEADGKTAGSYPIIVDLTGVSYTPNYRAAEPAFVNGTLTVNPAPSGGGGKTSAPSKMPQTERYISGNIVTAITPAEASVDKSGNWMASFSYDQIKDAIDSMIKEAEKLGEDAITNITLKVQAPTDAASIETNIPEEAIAQIEKAGINSLTVSTPVGDITFDSEAISDLEKEAGDIDIKITRVDTSSLSPEAKEVVGDRPVYDITVTGGGRVISRFDGDVTVSIPYTPKEDEDVNAIVIYYINEFGELEVVTNCIYDHETGMVSFTTRHFSIYAVGYNKVTFKDVPENAWYSKAVTFIAARGITSGTGDGNFSPEAKLTRGQFIVMLMKAYGIAPNSEAKDNFRDAGNTYYTGYLAAAKRLNISKGVGNNEFKPEKDITRQEMFTLLYNALKAIEKLPEKKAGKKLSAFADADSIASWAMEAMEYLVESGIISGDGGRLNPTSTTSRAEMAQVLYNLLLRVNLTIVK